MKTICNISVVAVLLVVAPRLCFALIPVEQVSKERAKALGMDILVTHTVKDWETRVVAVDTDGQEHPATGSESSGTDAFTTITAKFPELPLERVKEFQFQIRPYQWVEFRKVTLYPSSPGVSAMRAFQGERDPVPDQNTNEFKASFDKLTATLQGMFADKSPVAISADGTVECSLTACGVTNYQSRFRLRPADLRDLERTLEQTDWLTRPLPDKRTPRVVDATYVNVAVIRHGQERAVRFDLQSPEPYRSLGVFIWRLRRQEQLQAELTAASDRERRSGSTRLIQALDQSRNSNAAAWDLPLDFHRFVPAMSEMLASPHYRDGEELVAASRLMAALKIESQRANLENLARHAFRDREPVGRLDDARVAAVLALRELGSGASVTALAALAQDQSSWVRAAVAEALQTVPPDQAIPILTNMTASTRPAAWTLIRLGPPAVPAIIGILQLNEHDHKESGPYRVTREYYEHWEEIPKPADLRVLRAIRRRVELGLADDYALKILEKAGQPFKPVNARRTLEQFLTGTAAGDAQELDKVTRIHFRANAPGEFLTQAKAGRLKVDRCYAERSTAWAIVADTQDAKRTFFVWMNQESGRIWEIAATRPMTREEADRELKRILKDDPSATEVPADSEASEPSTQAPLIWQEGTRAGEVLETMTNAAPSLK